jgi:hypothetical protein
VGRSKTKNGAAETLRDSADVISRCQPTKVMRLEYFRSFGRFYSGNFAAPLVFSARAATPIQQADHDSIMLEEVVSKDPL